MLHQGFPMLGLSPATTGTSAAACAWRAAAIAYLHTLRLTGGFIFCRWPFTLATLSVSSSCSRSERRNQDALPLGFPGLPELWFLHTHPFPPSSLHADSICSRLFSLFSGGGERVSHLTQRCRADDVRDGTNRAPIESYVSSKRCAVVKKGWPCSREP